MMGTYWGWGGWLGMLAMVVGWAGVFALTVWLVVRATRTDPGGHVQEPAQAILDRRFASGEISADECAAMRRSLEHHPIAH